MRLTPELSARVAWADTSDCRTHAVNRVVARAEALMELGVKTYDALHVASAQQGGADLFVTTDDRLLKVLRKSAVSNAYLPADALAILENWYEN